jgi:hypothetical protein
LNQILVTHLADLLFADRRGCDSFTAGAAAGLLYGAVEELDSHSNTSR